MKQSHFYHVGMGNLVAGQSGFTCWYNFMKINLKVLGVCMVRNGYGKSCDVTLKLTVSEEWTDGINWFLAFWCRFTDSQILKADQNIFGWA